MAHNCSHYQSGTASARFWRAFTGYYPVGSIQPHNSARQRTLSLSQIETFGGSSRVANLHNRGKHHSKTDFGEMIYSLARQLIFRTVYIGDGSWSAADQQRSLRRASGRLCNRFNGQIESHLWPKRKKRHPSLANVGKLHRSLQAHHRLSFSTAPKNKLPGHWWFTSQKDNLNSIILSHWATI